MDALKLIGIITACVIIVFILTAAIVVGLGARSRRYDFNECLEKTNDKEYCLRFVDVEEEVKQEFRECVFRSDDLEWCYDKFLN